MKSRQTYGSPRITAALRAGGELVGCNRIARLMHVAGLQGRQKRRYRVRTTDSRHDQPIAPNHLAIAPAPTQPNQIWVTDMTYIETGEGWLYLAGVLDLYSRRLIGWAMGATMETTLPLAALNMALRQRQPVGQVLHHSDRGSQYASAAYRQALADNACTASMSRKGNCYDNATMESFWSTLKHGWFIAGGSTPGVMPPPPSSITSRAFITEPAFTQPSALKAPSTTKPPSTN
jgi:transposase InsO family protein